MRGPSTVHPILGATRGADGGGVGGEVLAVGAVRLNVRGGGYVKRLDLDHAPDARPARRSRPGITTSEVCVIRKRTRKEGRHETDTEGTTRVQTHETESGAPQALTRPGHASRSEWRPPLERG